LFDYFLVVGKFHQRRMHSHGEPCQKQNSNACNVIKSTCCWVDILPSLNEFTRRICLFTNEAHHSCRRTVRSSRYMVLDRKSIPIVAWAAKKVNVSLQNIIPTTLEVHEWCMKNKRRGANGHRNARNRKNWMWCFLSPLDLSRQVTKRRAGNTKDANRQPEQLHKWLMQVHLHYDQDTPPPK